MAAVASFLLATWLVGCQLVSTTPGTDPSEPTEPPTVAADEVRLTFSLDCVLGAEPDWYEPPLAFDFYDEHFALDVLECFRGPDHEDVDRVWLYLWENGACCRALALSFPAADFTTGTWDLPGLWEDEGMGMMVHHESGKGIGGANWGEALVWEADAGPAGVQPGTPIGMDVDAILFIKEVW